MKKDVKIANKNKPIRLCLSLEEIMNTFDSKISSKYNYILEHMSHLSTYIDKKVHNRKSIKFRGFINPEDLLIGLEELGKSTNIIIKYVDGDYLITFNIILSNQ